MHKLNTTKKRKIQQNKTVVGSVQSPLTTLGLCPEPTHNQFEDQGSMVKLIYTWAETYHDDHGLAIC